MYFSGMNILIRLPNWLGDMVMSSAFVRAVNEQYPGAAIDLVAKKGIEPLLDLFPPHGERYIFSKEKYSGLQGAWRFGKQIARKKKYDLFFCLPDSFSSALMGFASGAAKRAGYKKEARGVLLTTSFLKKENLHRVEEYLDLLRQYSGKDPGPPVVGLASTGKTKQNAIVININSVAPSRRLPEGKAISIINAIRRSTDSTIFLVGGPGDVERVDAVYAKLENKTNIVILAGYTGLIELAGFTEASAVTLSTDSGPAHLANAMGAPTIVLFGAGNENETAPYNKPNRTLIRLGKLSCEPCNSNTCKKYGVPECLLQLDETLIVKAVQDALNRLTSA